MLWLAPTSSIDVLIETDDSQAALAEVLSHENIYNKFSTLSFMHDAPEDLVNLEDEGIRELITKMREGLTGKERTVIDLYFGFIKNDRRWTYAEIGKEVGLTTERVRQIKLGVINRLASPHGQFVADTDRLGKQFQTASLTPEKKTPEEILKEKKQRNNHPQE